MTNNKTLVLIGAGSTYFTRGIVQDLIDDGGEWTLRLADVSEKGLETAQLLVKILVEAKGAPIQIEYSTDHCELLAGADAVVTTIGVGGRRAWEKDVIVPREFGIYQSGGDTYGPGGLSRALRMIPVMVDVARDVARLCPNALFFNYANPMSAICRAIVKETGVPVVGLCSGVRQIHNSLARFLEVDANELWSMAVGVNHLTWITQLRYRGEDAWPMFRAQMKNGSEALTRQRLSYEMFETFGAFPCTYDSHVAEFFPALQKQGSYYGKTPGVDAEGYTFESYVASFDGIYAKLADEAHGRIPLEEGSNNGEELIPILRAAWSEDANGGNRFFTANLPNSGQIANLPRDVVVETTTLVNGGFHALSFGELPAGIAAILARVTGVQEITVEAALRADRNLVVQALLANGDVSTRAEAIALTDALLEAQREHLPRFYG